MVEMLNDEKIRSHFARAGAERVKQFTWEKTALETLKVYRSVIF
jgi:glycosyltransferase involved in cell wall biosynthesis